MITEVQSALQINGIRVVLNSEEICVGELITSVVLDIKERDACLMMNAGRFRCPCCYHYGCTYPPNSSVYFPFKSQEMPLQTKDSLELDTIIGNYVLYQLT